MIPNSENKRVWFITGASKGLGYAFTCAALKAGDKVVAVARTIDNLAKLEETYQESLLPLNLDVTDREAVFSTVETAVKHFGRLDIVVNNAGIMTMGMIEELNESDARKLMDTNFFWSSLGLSGSDALFEVAAFWTYHTDYKHWRYYLGSDVWYLQCK
ncbi:SDR family NAD(P)-dependent oxidoreductase [Escherichia coli]|nr:SDR family NAD(P)-dependent oxidoreductase [Escherichia coli]